jgi:cobalt/nickel transport system permease protein
MISEAFMIGDSHLHRLDPRLKIIAATFYCLVVALAMRFSALAAALLFSLILLALTCLPLGAVAKRFLPLNGFVAMFWLVLPFCVPGEPLLHFGALPLSHEGILLAARLTLKSNAILLALIALLATSSVAKLGHAMGLLRVPDKLVNLLLLTYRYIFVIEEEYQRLRRAARIRCFKPGTNLHTYRTYAHLVGMLLVRAEARAERVQQAMRCRGFHGRFYSLHELAFTRRDRMGATALGMAVTVIGIMEWTAIALS